MSPAEKKVYLQKLGGVLVGLARNVINDMKPFKCFIILCDENGNGTSLSSENFGVKEFMHYAKAIAEKNSTEI